MIIISTLMFTDDYTKLQALLDREDVPFGIELFPVWQDENFVRLIQDNKDKLKNRPLTMHGPYFDVEHSAKEGTELYESSMEELERTFQLCHELDIKTCVYHHNNIEVTEENKDILIHNSTKNLHTINVLGKKYCVSMLLENTGVYDKKNLLFDEQEFIDNCLKEECNVLIDVGHMNANKWNFEHVISSLKEKITHYHLNNNGGEKDDHERIGNGTIDYNNLKKLYQKYTPNAQLILEYGQHVANDIDGVLEDVIELQSWK